MLAPLLVVPVRVRSPAPILVSVLLFTQPLKVIVPAITFNRFKAGAPLPSVVVALQVVFPERFRSAPELFTPAPFRVNGMANVKPPETCNDAPAATVTLDVPSAPADPETITV